MSGIPRRARNALGGALAGLLVSVAAATACCPSRTPEEEFAAVDLVVLGTVAAVDSMGGDPTTLYRIRFDVQSRWKGPLGDSLRVHVLTPTTAIDCGYTFREGPQAYLLYALATLEPGVFTTDSCSRTRLEIEAKEDLAFLGPPLEPTPVRPVSWGWIKTRLPR